MSDALSWMYSEDASGTMWAFSEYIRDEDKCPDREENTNELTKSWPLYTAPTSIELASHCSTCSHKPTKINSNGFAVKPLTHNLEVEQRKWSLAEKRHTRQEKIQQLEAATRVVEEVARAKTALADAQKMKNRAEKWLKQQQAKSLTAEVSDHEVRPVDSHCISNMSLKRHNIYCICDILNFVNMCEISFTFSQYPGHSR